MRTSKKASAQAALNKHLFFMGNIDMIIYSADSLQ